MAVTLLRLRQQKEKRRPLLGAGSVATDIDATVGKL
jgi:hypothetical protein